MLDANPCANSRQCAGSFPTWCLSKDGHDADRSTSKPLRCRVFARHVPIRASMSCGASYKFNVPFQTSVTSEVDPHMLTLTRSTTASTFPASYPNTSRERVSTRCSLHYAPW